MLKPILRFCGVLYREDGSMVTPGQSLKYGTSHKFNRRVITDSDGHEYTLVGFDTYRIVDDKTYTTSGGVYGRHDKISKEADIARRERELADLKAS